MAEQETPKPVRRDHDGYYHRLFSDAAVVAQLLRGFVDPSLIAGLDLDDMSRLNTNFHTSTGDNRIGDMAWRIPRTDGADSYLLLMTEYQSTPDAFMAVRIMTYMSLLYQQQIRDGALLPGGKLPPILPIVLYNGPAPWRSELSVGGLIGLPQGSPLWRLQPEMRYYLIDILGLDGSDLELRDGLPALWFRLENASSAAQISDVVDALLAWFRQHPGYATARAVFTDLVSAMVTKLGPDTQMEANLGEIRSALLDRAEQWKQDWLLEGRQEGRQEGRHEGRKDGEAAMLRRLLEQKFGILPGRITDRLSAAGTDELTRWAGRLFQANTLEEVVGPPPV